MIVKNVLSEMLPSIWPLIIFVSLVAVSIRCAYLFKGSKKFVFHKEILSLVFIIYIICLYYILTYDDINYGGINLIPFKEMFRYTFGSYKFTKNIVGNILLFIPFGFFTSYYLNSYKAKRPVAVALIVSLGAEIIQYYIGRVFDIDDVILNTLGGFLGYLLYALLSIIKEKLPKFMKSDAFLNILVIVIIVIIIIFTFKIDVLSYL